MYRIVGADGQAYGPVNAEQLRRWLGENRVNARTLVQAEGSAEWKPLSAFPEFAAETNVPPPLSPLPGPGAPPAGDLSVRASNKIPAGIFGILLGAFGIHKFILGYTGAGLIMLLITVLTCGLAYPLMHLIGLIEGIIYLSRSDADFVRTYVDDRKEWF
jgi:TM2 domain-containing membrane protein YozV